MKTLSILAFLLTGLFTVSAFSQSKTDSLYAQKIANIEFKISEFKNHSKDQQHKYHTLLSDAENRKNTLKSLLKTPPSKRNKTWEDTWEVNYNKLMSKLYSLKTK